MSPPKVTVVCLCYNQALFVKEAIDSVLAQDYPSIELIIVDDASDDDSAAVIRNHIVGKNQIRFIGLNENAGNCKAFNLAYRLSEGAFIIDLAADDILLPTRVRRGVEELQLAGDRFGVNFSDALWVNESGAQLYRHSSRFPHNTVPQGDIYRELIERYFICSPTVMCRRSVMDFLNGYDESLAYEDFDFWIRSSRKFFYCYTPEVLVKKRVVRGSMTDRQFKPFSKQLQSTFKVCQKIFTLNRSESERKALSRRLRYEASVAARYLHVPLAVRYLALLLKNSQVKF